MMMPLGRPDGSEPRTTMNDKANVNKRMAPMPMRNAPLVIDFAFVDLPGAVPVRLVSTADAAAPLSGRDARAESVAATAFFPSFAANSLNASGEYARPTDQYVNISAMI